MSLLKHIDHLISIQHPLLMSFMLTNMLCVNEMLFKKFIFFGNFYSVSFVITSFASKFMIDIPDGKVHGANMGPIWGRQDPGGPHAGPHELCYLGWLNPNQKPEHKHSWYDLGAKDIPMFSSCNGGKSSGKNKQDFEFIDTLKISPSRVMGVFVR